MSLVIGAVSLNEVLIASDGRATHEDGSIYSESYDKTRSLSNNVIVGFSGDMYVCEYIVSQVASSTSLEVVDNVSSEFQKYLKNANLSEKQRSCFLVGGLNSFNCLELDAITYATNFEIQRQLFPINGYNFFVLSPDGLDGNAILLEHVQKSNTIEDALNSAIAHASHLNNTVNSTFFIRKVTHI